MKKFKYIIVLFVMGLISFSCTDLDEEIFSEITTDNYYQNSNNIYAALVNNYAKAFSTGWSDARYFLQEVTADQLMIPTRGKHGYNGGEYVRLHEHKWTVEENFVYNGWAAPFQGIALCNNTLSDFENLDFSTFKLTEETKNEYIAELRALRVWNYMFLIDFFRHVPIVTDIEEVKAQSTPLEVFNFMESELLAILPDLPKNRGVSRFDQAGVASILVRLYLNAEKWIGISKYDECEQMAQAILDGKYGEYSIDPDYRGPFRSGINGYRSKENIMEFAIKKNYFEASWLYNMCPFGSVREAPVEELRHHHAQNGIPQKFQPLVAEQAFVIHFIGVRGMGQGVAQEALVPKGISQRLFQGFNHCFAPSLRRASAPGPQKCRFSPHSPPGRWRSGRPGHRRTRGP